MRKILATGLVLGLATLTALPVSATPFAGQTISNLAIGGSTYNVAFFDAAYVSIPAAQRQTFTTAPTALTALNAIMSSSGYATILANANRTPTPYFVGVVVPYSGIFSGTTGPFVLNAEVQTGPSTTVNPPEVFADTDYTANGYTFATFSAGSSSTSSVPEPASIAIVAFGLFGLGWARRKFFK